MRREKKTIDAVAVEWATSKSSGYMKEALKRADKYLNDPDKERRLSIPLCLFCHYTPRIGGAAMTIQPCGVCDKEEMHSSTATDALCQPCASALRICKRCGADLEFKARRNFVEQIEKRLVEVKRA